MGKNNLIFNIILLSVFISLNQSLSQNIDSTKKDIISSLYAVNENFGDLRKECSTLLKRLHNQKAYGTYEGVTYINTELRMLEMEVRHIIVLYYIKNNSFKDCTNLDINKILEDEKNYVNSNIDYHNDMIEIVITEDVRESVYELGVDAKKTIKKFRKILSEL